MIDATKPRLGERAPIRRLRAAALAMACAVIGGLICVALLQYNSRLDERDVRKLQRVIDAALRSNDMARAEVDLQELLRLRPNDAEARQMLGEIYASGGRWGDALAEFARVPHGHHLSPRARLQEGRALLRVGRAAAAESALKDCLREQPDSIEARGLLAYIYQLELRYKEHKRLLGEMADLGARLAVSLRGRRLQTDPRILKLVLATDILERDQPEDIAQRVQIVRRFLAADPDDQHAQLALARFAIMQGELAEARPLLVNLRLRLPQDIDALAAQIECELAAGEAAAAQQLLSQWSQGPEPAADFCLLQGLVAEAVGNQTAALMHFQRAIDVQPLSRQARYCLGRLLQRFGRVAESASELARVQQLDELESVLGQALDNTPNTTAHHQLAAICEKLSHPWAAAACYEEILRIDPSDAVAQQKLAQQRNFEFQAPGSRQ